MSQSVRKRCRDPLGKRVVENRYKAKSQIKNYFLGGSRSLHVLTPAQMHEKVENARESAAISRGAIFTPQKNSFSFCKFFKFGDGFNSCLF